MVYSIIIPHRNVPLLLKRLLDSIPIREDTEVIIVDDNSDESVVDFNDFPGTSRPNTKCVFLKECKGAGHARNIGIQKAKGKWLLFADSDDLYTNKIGFILDKYANDNSTDLVILNSMSIDDSGKPISHRLNLYIDNYLKKRFYSEKVVRYQIWTPWSRMVKRDFVNLHNLRYEEIPVGNDVMFCLRCSQKASVMMVEKEIVYYYYMPTGRSLTDSYYANYKTLELRIDKAFRQNQLYKEVHYAFKPSHLLMMYFTKRSSFFKKDYVKKYKEYLKKNDYSVIRDFWYLLLQLLGRSFKII